MSSLSGKKRPLILLIEDEADIRIPISEFLASEGYEVVSVQNGKEALDWLAGGAVPRLILLDMKMPVMSGWEFAQAYFATHDHDSPILVMTAAADAEARAKEVHADAWLCKPFRLEELMEQLHRYSD